MSFIENFRAIAPNKLPNNAPLKQPTPVWERSGTFTPTEEQRRVENQIRSDEFNRQWDKEEMAGIAANRGTMHDILSRDIAFNFILKNKDVINNRDRLIDVLDEIGAQNNWDDRINVARNASRRFGNSDGIAGWFDVIGDELDMMKYQYEESNGEHIIDPKYFLRNMRSMLQNIDYRPSRLV